MKILFLLLLLFKMANALELNKNNVSSMKILPENGIYFHDNEYFIGLKISLHDGWKTYWKNPGDAGLPITLDLMSPKNIDSHEVLFPFPKQYTDHGLKTIGYEKEVIFPIKLNLKDDAKRVSTKIKASYLVCKDICIPENKTVSLIADVESSLNNFEFSQVFASYKNVPALIEESLTLEFVNSEDDKLNYEVKKKGFTEDNFEGYLSKGNNDNLDYTFFFEAGKLFLSIFSDDILDSGSDSVFLSFKNGTNYEEVKLDFINRTNNPIYFVIFAFIGGLILNFMPCVLPVLSLKLYSLAKFREVLDTKKFSRFTTTNIIGIFSSFLLLALFVIILKMLGHEVGWGFQFQNFYFVLIITLFIFVFSLNLLGFFELILPAKINNYFVSQISKEDVRSNFLSGVFSTLLATPCSAPFLGTAVGFAMMASEIEIIYIFLSIALGFSTPYFLLLLSPNILNIMPKSGKWMDNFKFLMGILLLLTFCWLSNIMGLNIYLILLFASLILITCIFLKYGHFKLISGSFIIGCFITFVVSSSVNQQEDWIKFDSEKLEELVKENHIVFVDFTADWCVTCQVNKFTTLESKTIRDSFQQNNVKLLRADWTKKDESILVFMSSFGRFGIPLNIIYGPKNKSGKLLPEILSKNSIINSIDEIR